MSDVFSKEKRSEIMSLIRGSGNKDTELLLMTILRENNITGWRRNQKILGKPDFTFWKQRIVLFVDGCFWHCCPMHSTIPKSNQELWIKKLNDNKARDLFVTEELQKKGWKVVRIWEHDLKNVSEIVDRIIMNLLN